MPAMRIIETTKELWAVPPKVPAMLRAPSELNKTGQGKQGRTNACCDCKGEGFAQSGRNLAGIEITGTSFYYKGHE
jgi:hypothetical protein